MFQIIAPSIYKYDEDHEKTEKLFEVSPFASLLSFQSVRHIGIFLSVERQHFNDYFFFAN